MQESKYAVSSDKRLGFMQGESMSLHAGSCSRLLSHTLEKRQDEQKGDSMSG